MFGYEKLILMIVRPETVTDQFMDSGMIC